MAPGAAINDDIYSATYSGVSRCPPLTALATKIGRSTNADILQVPVFEFNVQGNHIMRRRKDDYINATHILKVADYDKPARTRILEREVQKGTHQKVQGGYGKYQGTQRPMTLNVRTCADDPPQALGFP